MSDKLFEKTLSIAHVTWEDCESMEGWHDALTIEDYIRAPLSVMKSVGWLLHDGDDWIILAASVGTHNAGDLTKIPRAMVLDVHVLAEPNDDSLKENIGEGDVAKIET